MCMWMQLSEISTTLPSFNMNQKPFANYAKLQRPLRMMTNQFQQHF